MEKSSKYLVILPEYLPERNRNLDLVSAYSKVEKTACTEAPTGEKALSNVVFRAPGIDTRSGRLITGFISRTRSSEIYEVPVVDEEGGVYRMAEEHLLADELEKRRGITSRVALMLSRDFFDNLIRR